MEENSIYEIDSVKDYQKIRKDSFYTKISNFYELKPNLFLLDFLGLIQYTSENLTFKGSPERLTRCQRKEATMEQVSKCLFATFV